MSLIKRVFSASTNATKTILTDAAKGIDEALNGSDVAVKRAERRLAYQEYQSRLKKRNRLIYYIWVGFVIVVICTSLVVIEQTGFSNRSVKNLYDNHSVTLLYYFLTALLVHIVAQVFFPIRKPY